MKRILLVGISSLLSIVAAPACSPSAGDGAKSQSLASTIGGSNESVEQDGSLSEQHFCPRALVPRKDMARYLERLKRGRNFIPDPARNTFGDVPRDSEEAAWIEQLAADGITRGTGPGAFSPEDTVPREQMAAFIVRLYRGPDFSRGGPSRFSDVTNPDFVGSIEELADMGITKGCTPTEFCPNDMVPRDQMAAFLMRAAHPGSPDPKSSGRFVDTPQDNVLAGRVEQAVSEGIMEPCGTIVSRQPLVVGIGHGGAWGFGFDFDLSNPPPTIDNFVGFIGTTPNYGLYVHSRDKHYMTNNHRSLCGGDYNATAVVDIGEVSHEGVYVRSVTYYTQGVPPIVHQGHVWIGTNHNMERVDSYRVGVDDSAIPYISFSVERFFPNGQAANGDALQIQHTMIPDAPGIEYVEWIQEAAGRAGVSAVLADDPDGGNCAMVLRGGLAIE